MPKLKQQISELAGPSVVLPPSPVQSKGKSNKKRNGKNRANPESTTGQPERQGNQELDRLRGRHGLEGSSNRVSLSEVSNVRVAAHKGKNK